MLKNVFVLFRIDKSIYNAVNIETNASSQNPVHVGYPLLDY